VNPKPLAMVGGAVIPLTRPIPTHLDPDTVLRAQEYVQLALGSLFEAQGYTGRATVGQLLDSWCDSCRGLSGSTQAGYRHNVRSWCRELGRQRTEGEPRLVRGAGFDDELERLGRAWPVADLQPALVERAIDGLATGRWNSVSGALRTCFRWANRHGFAGVAVLAPAMRRHKPRPVTIPAGAWARAAHALYAAYESARERSRTTAAAALCSVRWGVRRGAVARLEWAAVAGREIRLADKGRARIVVLDELDELVLASLPRKGPFVFAGRRRQSGENGHVDPGAVSKHTRRVLHKADLRLTLHQAGRHAAGVAVLALGGTPDDVAAHLGHANDRVTRERYLPAITDTTRARALLREAWAGSPFDEEERDRWARLARQVFGIDLHPLEGETLDSYGQRLGQARRDLAQRQGAGPRGPDPRDGSDEVQLRPLGRRFPAFADPRDVLCDEEER
jgi:integrase